MPLIFDKYSINTINGPYQMNVLIQKPEVSDKINNTIILFGETHTLEKYRPCNDPDCSEILTDYIYKLNIFANYVRTEFYLEEFDLYYTNSRDSINTQTGRKNQMLKNAKAESDFTYNLRTNPDIEISTLRNIPQGFVDTSRKSNISNMIEMRKIYKLCFNKTEKTNPEYCRYNNIIWQYADIRSTNKYNIYDISTIFNLDTMYNTLLDIFQNKTQTPIDNYSLLDIIEFLDINMLISFLNNLKIILTDIPQYVNMLLDTTFIKKQFLKLDTSVKDIFTVESFVRLVLWYKALLFSDNTTQNVPENYVLLIDKLIEYYKIVELDTPNSEAKLLKIITDINNIPIFTTPEFKIVRYYHSAIPSSVLDIYFILRIYKENIDRTKVFINGYFGSNHVDGITYYLTEIVQTHTCPYKYVLDTTNDIKIAQVDIPDNININEIMNIPVEDIQDAKDLGMLIVHPNPTPEQEKSIRDIDGGKKNKTKIKNNKNKNKTKTKTKKNKTKTKTKKNKTKK
jgi:hypothetical protein